MGYYRQDDWILGQFLRRGREEGQMRLRDLTTEEFELVHRLYERFHEMNGLIAELLTIMAVLEKLNDRRIFYVRKNLQRMVKSLIDQRDFGWAVKQTMTRIKPDAEVLKSVRKYYYRTEDRCNYLRDTIIPENIQLTPVFEYMDIQGIDDLTKDIHQRFGDRRNLYDIGTRSPEAIQKYADDILRKVSEKGVSEKYLERLDAYVQVSDERTQKLEAEKHLEKMKKCMDISEAGMLNFHKMFHRAVHKLENIRDIHMDCVTVENRIKAYGRDFWTVLCCYAFQGKSVYRYAGENGDLVPTFRKAKVFLQETDARKAIAELERAHPGKVFDTIKLDYMEEVRA